VVAGGKEEVPKDGDRGEREGPQVVKGEDVRENFLSIVRKLRGVEPHIVAEMLSVPLWRISKVGGELKEAGLIKIVNSLPYLTSLSKANATYYIDAGRATALHDTLMNMVWARNSALGGRCREMKHGFPRHPKRTEKLRVLPSHEELTELKTTRIISHTQSTNQRKPKNKHPPHSQKHKTNTKKQQRRPHK
jgi:hypothetical protein